MWDQYDLLAARDTSEGTGKTQVGVCVASDFINTLHSSDASPLNWQWRYFCAELLVVCIEWTTFWNCQCFVVNMLRSHLANSHSILCSKLSSLWTWRHFFIIYFSVLFFPPLITITLFTWSICQLNYNTVNLVEINDASSMCLSALNRTSIQSWVFFSTHSHCLVR